MEIEPCEVWWGETCPNDGGLLRVEHQPPYEQKITKAEGVSAEFLARPGAVRMVDPNSIMIFDLRQMDLKIQRHALHEFDLRQFKQDRPKTSQGGGGALVSSKSHPAWQAQK